MSGSEASLLRRVSSANDILNDFHRHLPGKSLLWKSRRVSHTAPSICLAAGKDSFVTWSSSQYKSLKILLNQDILDILHGCFQEIGVSGVGEVDVDLAIIVSID